MTNMYHSTYVRLPAVQRSNAVGPIFICFFRVHSEQSSISRARCFSICNACSCCRRGEFNAAKNWVNCCPRHAIGAFNGENRRLDAKRVSHYFHGEETCEKLDERQRANLCRRKWGIMAGWLPQLRWFAPPRCYKHRSSPTGATPID